MCICELMNEMKSLIEERCCTDHKIHSTYNKMMDAYDTLVLIDETRDLATELHKVMDNYKEKYKINKGLYNDYCNLGSVYLSLLSKYMWNKDTKISELDECEQNTIRDIARKLYDEKQVIKLSLGGVI